MAHAYLLPIKTAAALFPLLALLVLVPTAVVLYRRHGVMSHGRTLSLYGFLYYAVTTTCLTLVPLPRRTPDMCRRYAQVAHPQWIPGHTLHDVWKEAGGRITPGALVLHNAAVFGVAFNLALFVPLGVFLRYHFRLGPRASTALGGAVSLLFEATQGTGVWGLYPCPYRLFDVDDLLVNTSGAALGWFVAGPLIRALPALETLDGRALARRPVPYGRRLTALVVDLAGFALTTAACAVVEYLGTDRIGLGLPLTVFAVWFVALPYATGATPGKRLLRLRLVGADGGRPAPWRLALRAAVLGAVLVPLLLALAAVVAVACAVRSRHWIVEAAAEDGLRQLAYLATSLAGPWLVVLLALGTTALHGLRVGRDARALGPHELLSGVRNTTLPHTRARSAPAPRPAPPAAPAARPGVGPGTGGGQAVTGSEAFQPPERPGAGLVGQVLGAADRLGAEHL